MDEEAFAPHNPRDMKGAFGSQTCRPGLKSGEMTLREVIAFKLDHANFSGVPPTALAEVNHPMFLAKYEELGGGSEDGVGIVQMERV